MPKGAFKEVQDYKLTRYVCYLTAQNGDPRKEEIAYLSALTFMLV
jgi:DNA-damage-inducible protein D